MNAKRKIGAALVGIATAATLLVGSPVSAHTTGIHDNCTELHKKWPHGVGTRNAVDKTTGTKVTNFYRNTDAYWAAENHNGTLDADNDHIACESR